MRILTAALFTLLVATMTGGAVDTSHASPLSAVAGDASTSRQAPQIEAAKKFANTWHRHANKRDWRWLKKHSTDGAIKSFRGEIKYLKDTYGIVLKFGKRARCSKEDYGNGPFIACWTPKSAPCELGVKRRNGHWRAISFMNFD